MLALCSPRFCHRAPSSVWLLTDLSYSSTPYVSCSTCRGPITGCSRSRKLAFRNQTRTGSRAVMATGSVLQVPAKSSFLSSLCEGRQDWAPNIILALALFETDLSTADILKLSHPWHASHVLAAEVPAESGLLPRPPKNSQHSTFASFSVGRY